MYRGSSIELNALGESWSCKKGIKIGYCLFESRQGIPGCDRVQEMPKIGHCMFRSRQGIPGCDRGQERPRQAIASFWSG